MTQQEIAIKTTYFSIVGNTCLAIIKWTAGYFWNSYALIADAIESTTDIFSSILVFLGIKYATKPPDKKHPYGHGRVEPLVTFIIVGFLIVSATIIAHDAIANIQTPHELPEPYTLLILWAIILWKELSYRFVSGKSEQTNSSSLKADAWHHRSDAITSFAAFIGISIALVMWQGYEYADDLAALFASVFILYNSYLIFRPALWEILDENTHDDLVKQIRKIAKTVAWIEGTEKCFIRKSGMQYHVDLHAMVQANISVKKGHDIAHTLKDTLRKELPQLGHVLIHIEPNDL